MVDEKRIVIDCPFCKYSEKKIVLDSTDEVFHAVRRELKHGVGDHIIAYHRDRIYEVMMIFVGPFQEFLRARIDGTRKEGRALTALQNVANEVTLT